MKKLITLLPINPKEKNKAAWVVKFLKGEMIYPPIYCYGQSYLICARKYKGRGEKVYLCLDEADLLELDWEDSVFGDSKIKIMQTIWLKVQTGNIINQFPDMAEVFGRAMINKMEHFIKGFTAEDIQEFNKELTNK